MKHVVECLVDFDHVFDLGPARNVSTGDWLDWTGRVMREVRSPRTSRRRFLRGERVSFASRKAAQAFLDFHQGKFKYIGV